PLIHFFDPFFPGLTQVRWRGARGAAERGTGECRLLFRLLFLSAGDGCAGTLAAPQTLPLTGFPAWTMPGREAHKLACGLYISRGWDGETPRGIGRRKRTDRSE